MNTTSTSHAGEYSAIAAILGLFVTWISANTALLSGIASIATACAAVVSIYLSIKRARKGNG